MPGEFTMKSEIDGMPLQGWQWWDGGRDPRANVIIAHGAGEHALRYDAFARRLTDRNIAVWALDHRGHGRTAEATGLGDFGDGGWDALVADVNLLTSHAAERTPGAPLLLFGHSMGSLAAQQIMVDRSRLLEGVVLSGTTCFDALADAAASGAGLESFNAPFEPARTPFDWLSRDTAMVDAYVEDPLCGTDPSPEAMTRMLEAALTLADPEELRRIRNDLPVLVIAGDADPLNADWSLVDALVARYRAAGLTEIEVHRREGARHEVLNETDRDAATEAIERWMESVIARY